MAGAGSTIAAIASPGGAGRRGVVRLSGPDAARIVARTCTLGGAALHVRERAALEARFHDGRGEQPVLVLWMPEPRSFTREDVAELHLPGAAPLLAAALARVLAEGAEPAPAGEFTRRAFVHGRIDLSRAQGVLALVGARTRAERRAASALVLGGLDRRAAAARDALEELRALCEASLDFDESDTGHVPETELAALGALARERLADAIAWEASRTRALAAERVVLRGRPNAGKSTLFNALVGEDRAIVSAEAGTTRDVVRAVWRVGERELALCDTAGHDAAARGVDASARARAEREEDAADLALVVVDASAPALPPDPPRAERERRILVWSKIDLAAAAPAPPTDLAARFAAAVAVSAMTGAGLAELERAVLARIAPAGESAAQSRELAAAHVRALMDAARELDDALEGLASSRALDLVAESLRRSTAALDAIDGRTTPDDVLARIFSRFCIGK